MSQVPVVIIAPCYNESVIVIKFLEALEVTLAVLPYSFCVVVIDDCSDDDTLPLLKQFRFRNQNIVLRVITLRFNVGHQAAIYQGFLYALTMGNDYVIVMDSDGEDTPAAIPALLAHGGTDIVNVVRSNRRESLFFRFCYTIYKIIFRLTTRRQMNFGNFCLISRRIMELAVFTSFTHFAAFLSKQKCTTRYIVAPKEERIGGHSKMNFRKLLYHGIKSFAEYGETIVVLFLKGFFLTLLFILFLGGSIIYKKLVLHEAIHEWMGIAVIGLVNLAVICIGFFVVGLLLVRLYKRNPNLKTPIYEVCAVKDANEAV